MIFFFVNLELFVVIFFSGMQNNKMSTVLKLSLAFGLMGTTTESKNRVKFYVLRGFF